MMAEVAELKSECEGLEGKDDEQSKTNLAELVHEIEKQQDSLKEVISNMGISQYTFIQHIPYELTVLLDKDTKNFT